MYMGEMMKETMKEAMRGVIFISAVDVGMNAGGNPAAQFYICCCHRNAILPPSFISAVAIVMRSHRVGQNKLQDKKN